MSGSNFHDIPTQSLFIFSDVTASSVDLSGIDFDEDVDDVAVKQVTVKPDADDLEKKKKLPRQLIRYSRLVSVISRNKEFMGR